MQYTNLSFFVLLHAVPNILFSVSSFKSLQFMKELNALKQIRGPDPNYNDICFSGAPRYLSIAQKDTK